MSRSGGEGGTCTMNAISLLILTFISAGVRRMVYTSERGGEGGDSLREQSHVGESRKESFS